MWKINHMNLEILFNSYETFYDLVAFLQHIEKVHLLQIT